MLNSYCYSIVVWSRPSERNDSWCWGSFAESLYGRRLERIATFSNCNWLFFLLWSENKEHSRTNDTVKRIERDKQIKQSVSQFYASLSPGTDSTSVIPSIGTIRFSFDISVYLVTKCVNRWHKYVSFSNSSNTLRWWKYACEKMR